MSFSQLPAVKKETENCAPGNFFGPSYFEAALSNLLHIRLSTFGPRFMSCEIDHTTYLKLKKLTAI